MRGIDSANGNVAWVPNVDVFESNRDAVLRFELPGVDRSSIMLEYDPRRNVVVLRGTRSPVAPRGADRYVAHQIEMHSGSFVREVALPSASLDVLAATCEWHDGILDLAFPKLGSIGSPLIVETISLTLFR